MGDGSKHLTAEKSIRPWGAASIFSGRVDRGLSCHRRIGVTDLDLPASRICASGRQTAATHLECAIFVAKRIIWGTTRFCQIDDTQKVP